MDENISLQKAKLSLRGLSVGDAFGENFFDFSPFDTTADQLPYLWEWTDDTHMALSIVEILREHENIEQDELAKAFARRYIEEPDRGYAGGAVHLLTQISEGGEWRELAPKLFDGGSYGNGSAMRAGPIGAYFFNDLPKAAEQAKRSAMVTHAHIEGQAGAIAVAVAAAIAANSAPPTGNEFLDQILPFLPTDTITRKRIQFAKQIPADDLDAAITRLGTGHQVSAQDTIPFSLWVAAHNLNDYEGALWQTAKGLGDVDTTCAIVGSVVALSATNIPPLWLRRREPLPSEFELEA